MHTMKFNLFPEPTIMVVDERMLHMKWLPRKRDQQGLKNPVVTIT